LATIIGWYRTGVLKLYRLDVSGSEARYANVTDNITISGRLVDKFPEIYAIIAIDRQFDYKRGNLPGLNSVRGLPKINF